MWKAGGILALFMIKVMGGGVTVVNSSSLQMASKCDSIFLRNTRRECSNGLPVCGTTNQKDKVVK